MTDFGQNDKILLPAAPSPAPLSSFGEDDKVIQPSETPDPAPGEEPKRPSHPPPPEIDGPQHVQTEAPLPDTPGAIAERAATARADQIAGHGGKGPLTFATPPDGFTEQELGLLDYHRRNLADETYLDDAQGLTTVNIRGVTGPDGRIYNVPGFAEGRRLTDPEARARAQAEGWDQYPAYDTGPASNEAAQRLHEIIDRDAEAFYAHRGGMANFLEPSGEPSYASSLAKAVPAGALHTSSMALEGPALSVRMRLGRVRNLTQRVMNARRLDEDQYQELLQDIRNEDLGPTGGNAMLIEAQRYRQGNTDPANIKRIMSRYEHTLADDARKYLADLERQLDIPPEHKESFWVQAATGLGSTVPFIAARALPGGQAVLPGLSALVGSGESIRRAADNGASDEVQARAGLLGVVPGLTDVAPIEALFGKNTRFPPGLKGALYGIAKMMVKQGIIEGTQEGVQGFMQNAIERWTSRPDKGIAEGVGREALVGMVVGMFMGGAAGGVQAASGGQPAATDPDFSTPEEFDVAMSDPQERVGEARADLDRVLDDFDGPQGEEDPDTVPDDPEAEIGPQDGATQPQEPVPAVAVHDAGAEAATSPENDLPAPTDAQKKAGNYKKGHVRLHGLDITIENPLGSERSGVDPDGQPWTVEMPAAYGYVRRTSGADGDQVDVYIGPEPDTPAVYIIDQVDPDTGAFDEHKVMMGFGTPSEAIATYQAAFSDGRGEARMGAVTPALMQDFKNWLSQGARNEPVGALPPPSSDEVTGVVGENTDAGPGAGEPVGGSASPPTATGNVWLGHAETRKHEGFLKRLKRRAENAGIDRGRIKIRRQGSGRGALWEMRLTDPTPDEVALVDRLRTEEAAASDRRSEQARKRGPIRPAGPMGPAEFLARNGGIRPSGELDDMGAADWHVGKPGMPRLVRGDGLPHDRAREILEEYGYLRSDNDPDVPRANDIGDVWSLLDDDIRGIDRSAPEDRADDAAREVDEVERRNWLEAQAAAAGVEDPESLSDEDLDLAVMEASDPDAIAREVMALTDEEYAAILKQEGLAHDDEHEIPFATAEARSDSARAEANAAPSEPVAGKPGEGPADAPPLGSGAPGAPPPDRPRGDTGSKPPASEELDRPSPQPRQEDNRPGPSTDDRNAAAREISFDYNDAPMSVTVKPAMMAVHYGEQLGPDQSMWDFGLKGRWASETGFRSELGIVLDAKAPTEQLFIAAAIARLESRAEERDKERAKVLRQIRKTARRRKLNAEDPVGDYIEMSGSMHRAIKAAWQGPDRAELLRNAAEAARNIGRIKVPDDMEPQGWSGTWTVEHTRAVIETEAGYAEALDKAAAGDLRPLVEMAAVGNVNIRPPDFVLEEAGLDGIGESTPTEKTQPRQKTDETSKARTEPVLATDEDSPSAPEKYTAQMQAGDSDETVTVRLTDAGPWDFNETFPLPDLEHAARMEKEGRESLHPDEQGVEGVVSVIQDWINEIASMETGFFRLKTDGLRVRKGEKPIWSKMPRKKKGENDFNHRQEVADGLDRQADALHAAIEDILADATEYFSAEASKAIGAEGERWRDDTVPDAPPRTPKQAREQSETKRPDQGRDDTRPSAELAEQGEQTVIPGAERISQREEAERKMEGRKGTDREQKPMDEGLFDTGARAQTDMFDAPVKDDNGAVSVISTERDGLIEISKIETPVGARGKGLAEQELTKFLSDADEKGAAVALTPSADFGASKSRLTEWYKRHGFVPNRGKNKDFRTQESMIRPAKTSISSAGADGRNDSEPEAPERIQEAEDRMPERPSRTEKSSIGLVGFYSPLERAIEQKVQNKARPAQILATIKKAQVKAEEIKWSGIEEWLGDKPADEAIIKDDLIDFVRSNQIVIEEVPPFVEKVIPDLRWMSPEADTSSDEEFPDYVQQEGEFGYEIRWSTANQDGVTLLDPDGVFVGEYRTSVDAMHEAYDHAREKYGQETEGETAWDDSRMLNGPDYREVLFKWANPPEGTDFYSVHWDADRNVIAHVRFSRETDVEGRDVLHIEELQSDWHQQGRDRGYMGEAAGKGEVRRTRDGYAGFIENHIVTSIFPDEVQAEIALARAEASSGVNDAPFRDNRWMEMAVKRLLRMAVDEGADGVTWNAGEHQLEIYPGLEGRINKVVYDDYNGELLLYRSDRTVTENVKDRADVERIVGPSIAAKLFASRDLKNTFKYELEPDEEFNWGGQGMMGFYGTIDQATGSHRHGIVGNFVKKYVKKWGAEVGQTEHLIDDRYQVYRDGGLPSDRAFFIRDEGDPDNMRRVAEGLDQAAALREAERLTLENGERGKFFFVPVTEAMREGVQTGQPLFRADGKPMAATTPGELHEAVREIVSRLAPRANLKIVDRFFVEGVGLLYSGASSTDRQEAAGSYRAWDNLITVSMGMDDPRRTARHEAIHHLRELGLFTDREWRVLENMARKKWRAAYGLPKPSGADEEAILEEAIAYAFSDHLAGKRVKGAAAALFDRIVRFLEQLANALRGLGFRTWEDVFAMADAGTAGRRAPRGRPSRASAQRYAAAYHGSPHDFDAFTTDKIGTGEGAQAYGWGLYFASKKGVAEHYREALSGRGAGGGIILDGRFYASVFAARDDGRFSQQEWEVIDDYELHDSLASIRFSGAIKSFQEHAARYGNDAQKRAVENLVKRISDPKEIRGRLYTVDLAPAEDEYLYWDKPLSEQSEKVKAALGGMPEDEVTAAWKSNGAWEQISGQVLYRHLADGTTRGAAERGKDREASLALADAGIPGIKYLDGQSRNRPLKDIKREFLEELPEDADISEVEALIGTGHFSPGNNAVLEALRADDWLGFDYPSQAISAALSNDLSNYDPSPALRDAISALREGGTYNYVIFDASSVSISDKFSTGRQLRPRANRVKGTDAQEDAMKETMILHDHVPLREHLTDIVGHMRDRAWLEIKQGLFDQFAVIEDYELKQAAENRDHRTSAHVAALRTQNLEGVLATVLKKGPLWYDPEEGATRILPFYKDDTPTRGFQEIFKPVADSGLLQLWKGWATAKRAGRLIEEGREANFSQEQIDELLKLGDQYPEFQGVFDEWIKFNDAILDFAEQAGLIDTEQRAVWQKADYIPFYRVLEDRQEEVSAPLRRSAIEGQRAKIRRLKGGEEKLNDPIENMWMNTSHLIDAAFKNMAAVKAAALIDGAEVGGKPVLEPVASLEAKTALIPEAEAGKIVERAAGAMEAFGIDTSWLSQLDLDGLAKVVQLVPPTDKGVISIMVGGKARYYRVNDPLLYRALTSLHPEQITLITRFLGMYKRGFTKLITSDPAFMLRNVIRDSWSTTTIYKDLGFARGMLGVEAFKGAIKAFNENEEMWEIMASGAASTQGYYATEASDVRRGLEDTISADARNAILDSPIKIWRAWQKFGSAFENANRIQVYSNIRKRGGSIAEAAHEAQDVLNFSMRGDWAVVRWLIATVPFMNARVQGLYRLGRAGRDNRNTLLIRGGLLFAASIAYWYMNKDDERYQDLPDWERDTYYHFWIFDEHFRLPKAFEIGAVFSTIPELALNAAYTGETKPAVESLGRMVWETFALNPTPGLLQPAVEQISNRNFFTGAPIVSLGLDGLEDVPETQYRENTSATAIQLGRGLARADDFLAGAIPDAFQSPVRIEHAVRGWGGTMGSYLLGAVDGLVTEPLTREGEKPTPRLDEIPIVKSFHRSDPPFTTRWVQDFYDYRREVSGIRRAIKKLHREGRTEDATRLRLKNRGKLRHTPALRNINRELSRIRKRMDSIKRDPKMGGDEKRRKLDQLLRQKAKAAKRVKPMITGDRR